VRRPGPPLDHRGRPLTAAGAALWGAATAWSGPLVDPAPFDPFAACVAAAQARAAPVLEALAALPPPAVGAPQALVVGAACSRDPRLPDLPDAWTDAARVGERLSRDGWQVTLLGPAPTADEARAAIATLADGAGDATLVYWSGHGAITTRAGAPARWLPTADQAIDAPNDPVWVDALESDIDALPHRRRLWMLDACFGGDFGARQVAPPLDPGGLRLYAAAPWERAALDPRRGGSPYTLAWLAAAEEVASDVDGDGCVGALEAHARATATLAADRAMQHPEFASGDLDPWAIHTCAYRPPTRAVVGFDHPTTRRLTAAGQVGALVAVPPGRVAVRVTAPAEGSRPDRLLAAGTLRVEPGEWRRVDGWASQRRGTAWIGLAGSGGTRAALPTAALGAEAWWLPASPRAWRPVFAARSGARPTGSVGALGCFRAATGEVAGGLAWRNDTPWTVAVAGALGAVGRQGIGPAGPTGCATGPPLGAWEAGWSLGRLALGLTADLRWLGTTDGPSADASVAFSLGWRVGGAESLATRHRDPLP